MRFLKCRLALALLLIPSVLSVLVNVTIDDTFADPLTGYHFDYSPTTSWSVDANCDGCSALPDSSQVYGRTWHTGTFEDNPTSNGTQPPTLLASVSFFGNAVYVYCVLSQSENSPGSNFSFIIDMVEVGNFTHQPLGQPGFQYNTLVFNTTSLSMNNHTLTIQNGREGGQSSLILLDYIVYTYDDGMHANTTAALPKSQSASTSPTTSSNTSRVVGAVLGTLFGLLFIGLSLVAYLRYKKGQPIIPTFVSSPRAPKHSRKGSSSFNPQLFVRKMINRMSTINQRAPHPPAKSRPTQLHDFTNELPYLSDPQLTGGTARSSPAPLLAAAYGLGESEPHYPSGSTFSSKMESIHRWQQQTIAETRGMRIPSMHFSEEVVSYYDDNATESHRVRTPPPPPRRYTVMNN